MVEIMALVTLDQVRETYEVRACLHGMVSELIVRDTDADGLAALYRLQDQLRTDAERADVDAYFWRNVEFRQAEAEVSGNRELARMLGNLGLRTLQPRRLSLPFVGRSVEDHERLLTAYADRDAEFAVAITRSIIMAGYRTIEASRRSGLAGGVPISS